MCRFPLEFPPFVHVINGARFAPPCCSCYYSGRLTTLRKVQFLSGPNKIVKKQGLNFFFKILMLTMINCHDISDMFPLSKKKLWTASFKISNNVWMYLLLIILQIFFQTRPTPHSSSFINFGWYEITCTCIFCTE